jgi:polyhydroxybutyrate depolymerase
MGSVLAGILALGCDVATDPVSYEDFIKAEGDGEFGVWVHSGLYNRTYYLHVPPELDESRSYPLLIFLHGNGGTGEGLHRALRADEATDEAGFITVYPDGLEGSWSVGCDECTRAEELEADDVTFLQTLSRHLSQHLPVDTTRIVVAGFSQGGSLAHLYGCRAANPPAGILDVAGLAFRSVEDGCEPSRPFPVATVHGTLDPLSLYGGYGFEAPLQSVPETLGMWGGVWGCAPSPVAGLYPDTEDDGTSVTTFLFTGCSAGSGVIHYRVEGGGHTWPGPTGPWGIAGGAHNRDLDTTREVLSFFASIWGEG